MTSKTPDRDALKDRARILALYGLEAHFEELTPDDLILIRRVLEWEEGERQRRSLERRVRNARIGDFKSMADFDWAWPKRCDREVVDDLLTLQFLGEGANAIFLGPNGVGKSTMAKNVAYQALLAGHTVRFVTASQMLNDLAAQDSAASLQRRLARYTGPKLLCVDELGYLSYGNRHADLLFEVVSRRYEAGRSTIITTNKPFAEWTDVFPNAACVVTLVDRLMHKADIVQVDGESYRLKEARERSEQKASARSSRRQSKRSNGAQKTKRSSEAEHDA
jgi:DNA replication protein DnaC